MVDPTKPRPSPLTFGGPLRLVLAGISACALVAVLVLAAVLLPIGGETGRPEAVSAAEPQQTSLAVVATDHDVAPSEAAPAGEETVAVLPPQPAPQALPVPWATAPVRSNDRPAPEVTAKAALVMDDASAVVLFEKDGHTPLPPASLTKIVTAILAIEDGGLDISGEVDVDYREMPRSSVMGLLPGDVFTLNDLLYGLMLPSGNDAALAIGRRVAGSDPAFVERMNGLAKRFGLTESHFANPHGLGATDHVMSAYDLAMYTRYGLSLSDFYRIVNTRAYTAKGSRSIGFYNINSFLNSYRGADGVKTGYTGRAGHTLVASAVRDGHRLIAVILNSPTYDADATKLLDWAFANHRWSAE